jgi:glycosyltransferase involved in cell wall biosynthesis
MANTTRTLLITAFSKKLFDLDFKLISYLRDFDYPKWLFKVIGEEVDKYLFVSDAVRKFYQLHGSSICLGSDIKNQLDKTSSKQVSDFKKRLKINQSDYVIGYLGRLVDWKGGEQLLESFSKLNLSNTKLVFFGTGEKQKGSIEQKLKHQIKKYRLDNQVILTGFVDDVALALKIMNCYVLPSQKPEPFATSVIEAAFAKLPIVATNVGGTPEFIKDQKNGLLVAPKNTNQLTQALLRLVEDQKLSKKLSEQVFKDAASFDQKSFVKQFEKELLG